MEVNVEVMNKGQLKLFARGYETSQEIQQVMNKQKEPS